MIFRNLFIDQEDGKIARVIWNYFGAIENQWGEYWSEPINGIVLNRTTVFQGLIQFLPFAYTGVVGPGEIPTPEQFNEVFARVNISGEQINRDNYPPGSGGAVRLREELKAQTGLQ